MGRALEQSNSDLYLDEEEMLEFNSIIEKILLKYPGFISMIDEEHESDNCGCLSTCVAISSTGDIKWCAMDDGSYCNSGIGNVFNEKISELYKKHHQYIHSLSNTVAPTYDTDECKGCEYLGFCRGCLLRSIVKAKELGDKCGWYQNCVPKEVKRYIESSL